MFYKKVTVFVVNLKRHKYDLLSECSTFIFKLCGKWSNQ